MVWGGPKTKYFVSPTWVELGCDNMSTGFQTSRVTGLVTANWNWVRDSERDRHVALREGAQWTPWKCWVPSMSSFLEYHFSNNLPIFFFGIPALLFDFITKCIFFIDSLWIFHKCQSFLFFTVQTLRWMVFLLLIFFHCFCFCFIFKSSDPPRIVVI